MMESTRTLKSSGVAWLGEIPEHWGIIRSRRLFSERKERARPGDTQLTASQKYGVISQARFMALEGQKVVQVLTGHDILKHVDVGDFVISMRTFQGGLEIAQESGSISSAYVPLASVKEINRGYFSYLFKSAPYIQALQSTSNLVRDGQAMRFANFVLVDLPLVPVEEQAAIAAFLDRETGKIDALVEEQKRLIKLLKEKRHAVISHAVTKGLDPNSRMKSSGMEWLGDVPDHWDVASVGMRYEVQLGRMLNEERAVGENMRPYLRVFDVQWGKINIDELPQMDFPPDAQLRYRLRSGDLMVNEGGSYVGRSAIWRGQLDECYYQKALHRLRPRTVNDTTEFFYYVMEMATQRGVFVAEGNQTTIDHLTAEQLRRKRFAFPPRQEQSAIAEYLNIELDRASKVIESAESAMSLLRERRSALISAAVSGKIDVRSSGKVVNVA